MDAAGFAHLAVEIVRAAPYGFAVTAEDGGPPSGRLVQHLAVDDDGGVVFSTGRATRKAGRVRATGALTYLVEDRSRFASVSLSGPARLEASPEARRRHWDEALRPFFPGGPDGDDFVLVVLATDRIELWSAADGIHPDPYGLAAATVVLVDGAWHRLQ